MSFSINVQGGTNAGWKKQKARTCPECGESHWATTVLCPACRDELKR